MPYKDAEQKRIAQRKYAAKPRAKELAKLRKQKFNEKQKVERLAVGGAALAEILKSWR